MGEREGNGQELCDHSLFFLRKKWLQGAARIWGLYAILKEGEGNEGEESQNFVIRIEGKIDAGVKKWGVVDISGEMYLSEQSEWKETVS